MSALKIPTESPESDGTADWDSTTVVLVELGTGNHKGLGYTYSDIAAAHIATELVRKTVLGRDVLNIAGIHVELERQVRNMGRSGLPSCAISAIDNSLWDMKAALLGLPLSLVLGQIRPHVKAYGSGGFTSYSEYELINQLAGWAAQGFDAVKMKIGTGDDTVERVGAVQKALCGSCELYVDANGAYHSKQALDLARRFADMGVTWFEEPVSSDDVTGLKLLVERIPAPIRVAAGEYIYTPDDAMRLLRHRAVDVLQADATRCGGVTDFVAVAHAAELHHLPFSAHTAPSVHASLCCSVAPAINVEYFHDHTRIEKMIFDGAVRAHSGVLTPDLTRTGLGLELKRPDIDRYVTFDSGEIQPPK